MAAVRLALPSRALFRLPPLPDPLPLAPPPVGFYGSSSAPPPFTIPQGIYAAALDVRVPLTVAAVYAVTVGCLGAYNRRRGRRGPWPLARTSAFAAFVVAHNIFLAVYSAWTFRGMVLGMARSMGASVSAPGPAAAAASWTLRVVDGLCRMHGPPGLGAAAAWNETLRVWEYPDYGYGYGGGYGGYGGGGIGNGGGYSGGPGRIWDEGLAFYGWLFYISKFYEVVDTLIILAKGRQSSVLQTYHHAGAMLAMWAGIRYMSPPIWMFVLINSAIHALMYTYYALAALAVPVPAALKRALTSAQIAQFIVGLSFGAAHLFVSYAAPVLVSGEPAGIAIAYETRPCINTSGAIFAIWLNVAYLAPLTWLFVDFFTKRYLCAGAAENGRCGEKKKLRVE